MAYVRRGPRVTRPDFRLLFVASLAAAVVGCTGTPEKRGFPWWPQSPGDAPGEMLRAAEAGPAQPTAHTETVNSLALQPANSPTQAVRYGDLLFVSGQIADDSTSRVIVGSDIRAQVRTAMDNLKDILEGHGLTMSNVLSVTLYLQDINDLPEADTVYASYFQRGLPARSVIRVSGLPKGSLVEISVIAGK